MSENLAQSAGSPFIVSVGEHCEKLNYKETNVDRLVLYHNGLFGCKNIRAGGAEIVRD